MNPTLVTVNTHSDNGPSRAVNVPLFIPNLDEVRALAMRLHADAQPY